MSLLQTDSSTVVEDFLARLSPEEYDPPELPQEQFDQLTEQSRSMIQAKVLTDSVNLLGGRLTTMEWTYPRMIHAEIMTHRQLSRNAASSRAIPLKTMARRILQTPVFPLHWGKNQKGMQATEELSDRQKRQMGYLWMTARDNAVKTLLLSERVGVHKQIGNRPTETWMWITIICSATNWENVFALRCHPDAEPHFQLLAYKAREAYDASTPKRINWGDWHLPLIGFEGDDQLKDDDLPKISAGRCARVSYLTHDGKRDPAEDIRLCHSLVLSRPMHASPLEHPARAVHPDTGPRDRDWGNFAPGWLQLRKTLSNECVHVRQPQEP